MAANAAVAAAAAAAADARYYRAPALTPRRSLCIDPDSNVCRLARMALDVQALMAECPAPDGGTLSLRIGLHVGATVGGVVGRGLHSSTMALFCST